jgi:DNA-binding PadR family transcriptional regulator
MPLREPKGRESREKSDERIMGLPVGFHILLALGAGPATGSEIAQRILGDTLGRYVSSMSLYDELHRLEERGWVMRWHAGWQRQVRLTPEGERRLKLGVRDLQRALEIARERNLC